MTRPQRVPVGRDHSLRRRIASAFAWMAVGVCIFFALVLFFFVQEIERHFLERRLLAVGKWQAELYARGVPAPLPPGFSFYSGPAIPDELTNLRQGYSELRRGKATLLVMRSSEGGHTYVVVDEIGDFRKIRREILVALTLGILACAALAFVLGRFTAGRVISPLTELVEAVRKGALDATAQSVQRDDEIGLLARTFADHSARLNQFLVRERLFTGDVSHELRTPLTVIMGAAEVLSVRASANPEMLQIAERIRRTASDTADRVGALLLMSRSPETLDSPRIALGPIIEREVERCKPLLAGRPVELTVEALADSWVSARAELVGMAVGNLLRNACSYTERGRVTVRLESDRLVIEDTGPGLPPQVQAQLFERFVRGDAVHSGSGLGLAIVKRICEHLEWNVVWAERTGGGSRFELLFLPEPESA